MDTIIKEKKKISVKRDPKKKFNPWVMRNLKVMERISVMTPSGWLEQDCWSDCD